MGRYILAMYKVLLLAAAAAAAPAPDQAPQYGPPQKKQYNPVIYNEKEEILPPQPFEYKYGVNDDYSQTSFDKVETQDDLGRVTGSYKVNLPDGRVQIVNYVSDENGYRADVTYEGEPAYPPPPPGGYVLTPDQGRTLGPSQGDITGDREWLGEGCGKKNVCSAFRNVQTFVIFIFYINKYT